MVYDERLADRVRAAFRDHASLEERKMFGGLTFMLDGHMCCGVINDGLMVRLGPEGAERALGRPQARPMDFTGRVMKGMVLVDAPGLEASALQDWVDQAVAFTRSLPARPST